MNKSFKSKQNLLQLNVILLKFSYLIKYILISVLYIT